MIARFRPSYTYLDIWQAFWLVLTGFPAEKLLAEKLTGLFHVRKIIFFNQARVGIWAIFKSLAIKGGVISPAYNCLVVPEAISYAGPDNHFADVSGKDFNMEAKNIKKALKKDSQAILMVHQFGIPAEVKEIQSLAKKEKLILIEDAAPALGASRGEKLVGNAALASVISFEDTKIICAVDGGAVLTNDGNLAEKIKFLAEKFPRKKSLKALFNALAFRFLTEPLIYEIVFRLSTKKARGFNLVEKTAPLNHFSLWSNFQAALVYVQFDKLGENLNKRRQIALVYLEGLRGIRGLILPAIKKGLLPSWERFPIRVADREKFFKFMSSRGVDLAWSFNYNCGKIFGRGRYPLAEEISQKVIDLPLYPDLSLARAQRIVGLVKSYFQSA